MTLTVQVTFRIIILLASKIAAPVIADGVVIVLFSITQSSVFARRTFWQLVNVQSSMCIRVEFHVKLCVDVVVGGIKSDAG